MTQTTRRTLFLAPLVLFLFAGCAAVAETLNGSGKLVTETRAVAGFSSISFALPGQLELTQGDTETLVITADDNVLREIETVVEKGSLQIRFVKKNLSTKNVDIRIKVTARTLEHIAVGGSGDIRSGALKAGKLSLSVGGSGNLTIASLVAGDVSAQVGGSGNITVKGGSAETLSASVGGSGNIVAGKLAARRASANIGGSGNAIVWASESLSANVAGSGNVDYYGDAKVSRAIVGSGGVHRRGGAPS
jgi:hypothetical protein